MKIRGFHRCTGLFTAIVLILAAVLPLSAAAAEVPDRPEANTQTRHTVCTSLSDAALAYYTGEYSYDNLSALPGASDVSDSYAATQDNELYDALQTLMQQTQTFYPTYSGYKAGSLAYYWVSTDAVAGSSTYVMFYSDVAADEEGIVLNREHVWPKSCASFYTSNGGSDLHHLRPSVESVNVAKGANVFGYVDGTYESGAVTGSVKDQTVYALHEEDRLFECKDDVKGDVARILLYVYCRWGQPNLYSDMKENLPTPDPDDTSNTGSRVIESLETLLQWCELDPVDEWEMTRNDLTEQIQGNRNVFIDYPELAWQLFGLETPAGMTSPTSAGCAHSFVETARQDAACTEDGSYTVTCSLCGNERTRRLAAVGHKDDDHDDLCDRCGAEQAIMAHLPPVTELTDGMHLVVYSPVDGMTFTGDLTKYGKGVSCPSNVVEGALNPPFDCAVFTVKLNADGTFLMLHNGKALSSGPTGNKLSLDEAPTEYSSWLLEPAGTEGNVLIRNANAAFYGKPQYLEHYNGLFTAYSYSSAQPENYTFRLFASADHYWDDGETLVEPTCTEDGSVLMTCRLCGETQTQTLPSPGGHDWGAWSVTTHATETAEGVLTRTCQRCLETETAVIPITVPVTVELGEGHDVLAETLFALLQDGSPELLGPDLSSLAVNGSAVTMPVPVRSGEEAISLGALKAQVEEFLLAALAGPSGARGVGTDGGETLIAAGYKPLSGYSRHENEAAAELLAEASDETALAGAQTLYALWSKPIDVSCVELTVQAPVCGAETQTQGSGTDYDFSGQTNRPAVSPPESDEYGVAVYENGEPAAYWCKPGDSAVPYTGVFTGGESYNAFIAVEAYFGHHFTDGTLLCVNGAVLEGTDKAPAMLSGVAALTAAHCWDGGTVTKEPTASAEGERTFTCTACGVTKTETIAMLTPHSPNTGDDGATALWLCVFTVSAGALLLLLRRKGIKSGQK